MKEDWHPADIIAAIKKKGSSLSAVSRLAGLNSSTLSNALARRWPKGEKIIADFLDLQPADIWPSRYIEKNNEVKNWILRYAENKI
nr:helix-turn-helix transcriptional regulator [Providencia stuartii]